MDSNDSIITKRKRCRPRSRETVSGLTGRRIQMMFAVRPEGVASYTRRRRPGSVGPWCWIKPLAANLVSAGYSAPELGWYTPRGVVENARFRS